MGFPENKEEILASAINNHFVNIWDIDCSHFRIGHCAIYLYPVLIIIDEV
jgi:hypothetical protein